MKIMFVTGSFPPMKCGVGDYTFNLANALVANGDIEIAVLTSVGACTYEGLEIFAVMRSWRMGEVITAIRTIHASHCDIVHIQYPTQGYCDGRLPWLLPALSFLMGKKVVQTWHEGYNSRRHAPELLLKLLAPSALVTLHDAYRELLHPMLRWALWKQKSVVIPIGSNIPYVHLSEQTREDVRQKYLKKNQSRLIVFFGFINPRNGIELLFDICNPESDHVVIAGALGKSEAYHVEITRRASTNPWSGRATVTGFLLSEDVGVLLAAADAVVLPFRQGRGEANRGTVYAAVAQGTFVITTSYFKSGYDKKRNIYYARPDDVVGMQSALKTYIGVRRESTTQDIDEWGDIASQHVSLYRQLMHT